MTDSDPFLVADALSVVTVALLVGVLAVLARRRREPSAIPFTALLASVTLWAVVELALPVVGVSLTRSIGGIEVGTLLAAGALLVLPVCWFWYVLTYTGRRNSLTQRRAALLTAPVFAAPPVAYALTAVGPAAADLVGPLVVIFVLLEGAYVVGLLLLGWYFLGRLAMTYNQVPFGQVLALGTATGLPYVATLVSELTVSQNGETVSLFPFDLTPIGFFVSAVLFAVSVWGYPILSVLPEASSIARDEVVEELGEGVIVLDRDRRVLDLNPTAARILDRAPTEALGEPVSDVLDAEMSALDTAQAVELATADGVRQFEITVSPLGDEGDPIGQTLVLRDVTERQTREQRLEVLNRVLRHNLRNNVDVILAHAETIDAQETRKAIREPARHLVGEAKKARDTERMLEGQGSQTEAVDVRAVVQSVADRLSDSDDDSQITVEGPEECIVQTQPNVVERIVAELVENAIEHNDQDAPRVDIELRQDEASGTIPISVADNGPGIPAHERRIAREETESQHSHGSGVGLWLVNWGVSHLGGTLRFEDREGGGSIVTVSLPAT